MKFVIAPDSYKGTLSQVEVALQMKKAIVNKWPEAKIILKPMADGGEGTLDALLTTSDVNEKIAIYVTGPLGKRIKTRIGIIHGETVVIEVATIAGLPLIPHTKRHPYNTTTYGIGEAIKFALDQGYRKFLIGLGGSATNDGGLGLLQALGVTMKTKDGKYANIFGKDLLTVNYIDFQTIDQRIWDCEITIASDVNNPLSGKNGATYVFGPQKGLRNHELAPIDRAMQRYASLLEKTTLKKQSYIDYPGAGSAGGLGFAFLHLKGQMISGAEIIGEMISLEKSIVEADVVFTGEGRSDAQTLYGKAPGYVARLAKKHDVPCLLISGSISSLHSLKEHFTYVYSLVDERVSLERALQQPKIVLLRKMEQVLTDLEKNIANY